MPESATAAPHITPEGFNRAITSYPWLGTWMGVKATEITARGAKVRLDIRPEFLRHGGTVSGPIVMAVADVAMYAAIMGAVPHGERAVTSDMTMHFMRRPQGAVLSAEARILRRGKRSIVLAVDVFIEGQGESVCHVVGSYALPGG
ncbi:MAG TPA: PaaI family thioesterase [Alphaproteobacteria bacterium]|jgi:uncharacterized protein (TIGR00369 family)